MIDESDPMVRAIQARFDDAMGRFNRNINDANAECQEAFDAVEAKHKEWEQARQQKIAEIEKKQAEERKKAEQEKLAATGGWQVKDWGDGSVMSFGSDADDRPAAPQPATPQAGRFPAPNAAQSHAMRPAPVQHQSPGVSAPAPASPPRPANPPRRRREEDDEDYSGFSWTQ